MALHTRVDRSVGPKEGAAGYTILTEMDVAAANTARSRKPPGKRSLPEDVEDAREHVRCGLVTRHV